MKDGDNDSATPSVTANLENSLESDEMEEIVTEDTDGDIDRETLSDKIPAKTVWNPLRQFEGITNVWYDIVSAECNNHSSAF